MRMSVFVRGSWLPLAAAGFLTALTVGRAQEPRQLGAAKELKDAFYASEARLRELVTGAETANPKTDKKHAEAAAQWYLYRLTIREGDRPIASTAAQKVQKEFHDKVTDLMHKNAVAGNKEFRKMFGAALVSNMKDVLLRDLKADPSTVIYAAEMLSDMARLKQDEVSAYLCELAKDGANPVVQLHALKALRETMPVVVQPTETPVTEADFRSVDEYSRRKNPDIKNVDALKQFIERPVNTTGMSLEEYRAVIFVRREAIISLAQAGSPAVIAAPNKKAAVQPQGVAAHTLLNVLAGNLQPPPTISEKVEAALGLCSMKYPNMPEYEPQVAIYLVGRTLEEFVAEYSKDWANFAAVGPGKKAPYMAFIGDARRLKIGLKDLAANTPAANPSSKFARELDTVSTPILDKIIGKSDASKYGTIQADQITPFRALISQSRPKTGYIFKTLKMEKIRGVQEN